MTYEPLTAVHLPNPPLRNQPMSRTRKKKLTPSQRENLRFREAAARHAVSADVKKRRSNWNHQENAARYAARMELADLLPPETA